MKQADVLFIRAEKNPANRVLFFFLRLSNAQLRVANVWVREGENAEPRLGAEEEQGSGSSPRLLPHSRSYSSYIANNVPPMLYQQIIF
jgi:hypothetical protein